MLITKEQENNYQLRTCRNCKKIISLLGTIDEFGNNRSYNVQPAHIGLCTCNNKQLSTEEDYASNSKNGL